jgi:hypothetical protein
MLPSQYPNNSNKNNKNNKKKYKQQQQQEHQHIHSARHVKSFDAFMDETNDEWSNDIFQQQQPKQAQPIKIQQQQQEPVKRKPKYKRIKPNVKDIISGNGATYSTISIAELCLYLFRSHLCIDPFHQNRRSLPKIYSSSLTPHR